MSFWSGNKLELELPKQNIVSPFKKDGIDCAAYKLRLGSQVYVSPGSETEAPDQVTIQNLYDHKDHVTVPPGQFAFVITEETVAIPSNVIAFISIRAGLKFHGLVNVSGFHVDPGYRGRLIFAVFNAGPAPVHLKKGDEYFLIWFADLDKDATANFAKSGMGFMSIPTKLINPIAGQVLSFSGLLEKIKDSEKKLEDRLEKVEKDHTRLMAVGGLALSILGGLIVYGIRHVTSGP